MLRRLASLFLLVWILGFIAFAVTLPRPAGDTRTDAVIALTGGEGRIARALEALHRHWAGKMLVSGVDPQVKAGEFASQYKVPKALMACCVTLDYESVDTRSNAKEAAQWIRDNHLTSVRLVTSDWHMRRAAFELSRAVPPGVTLVEDAVTTRPSFNMLFVEYNKLLARRIWRIAHRG